MQVIVNYDEIITRWGFEAIDALGSMLGPLSRHNFNETLHIVLIPNLAQMKPAWKIEPQRSWPLFNQCRQFI